jgi:hypothetical protein
MLFVRNYNTCTASSCSKVFVARCGTLPLVCSVADPDPHVFGPPGSGSMSQVWIRILLSSCKNSKKNLVSYYFVTLFDFLSLKKDVYVPSKSNKLKKLNKN